MILSERRMKCKSPEKVAKAIMGVLNKHHKDLYSQEGFYAVGMNSQLVTQYIDLVNLGGLASVEVHLQSVFREAVRRNVHSVALAHNHPAGNVNPSMNDQDVFDKARTAGILLQVNVLDNIIFSDESDEIYSESVNAKVKLEVK